MKEYVYSLNEQDFYEAEEISYEIEDEDEQREFVYRGEIEPLYHSDFLEASDIIESMADRAYDYSPNYSDIYISGLEVKEVEEGLNKVVLDYLNKNASQPNFFNVKNIKKRTLDEFLNQV